MAIQSTIQSTMQLMSSSTRTSARTSEGPTHATIAGASVTSRLHPGATRVMAARHDTQVPGRSAATPRPGSTAPRLASRVVSDRPVGWSSDPAARSRTQRTPRAARRRGQLMIFLASILTIIGIVIASGQLAGASDVVPAGSATEMVTVQDGDSLWSLATSAVSTGDPRDTVQRIRDLNGIEGSVIVPGDRLVVPVEDSAR